MLRAIIALALAAALTGCIGQRISVREYYEPTDATLTHREDGLSHGALKSETIKTGSPDWSDKSFSVIGVGR